MSTDYDVIVVGLGAMGSAAAYHLAAAGRRVLGLDRFQPPHTLGSTHGLTRIIREAYFEHPLYVPLIQRAYSLWTDLEQKSGRQLLQQTGGVMIGPPRGALVSGAARSAREHRLQCQDLSADQLRQRFPQFHPDPDMVALWEPRAGILFPERIVQTHLELATQHGAVLHFNEPVLRWEAPGKGVRVFAGSGSYTADRLLIAAGPWMNSLVPELKLPLSVERQVQFWFEPVGSPTELFQPSHCPVHIWEYGPHQHFYGLPDLGDGLKVAIHHQGEATQPDSARRDVDDRDVEQMRGLLRRFLPAADGRLKSATVCLYTNTPTEHFLLDVHPAHPEVFIASPCSGHGFKFSSVIGEIAAAKITGQAVPFDLSLFSIPRL